MVGSRKTLATSTNSAFFSQVDYLGIARRSGASGKLEIIGSRIGTEKRLSDKSVLAVRLRDRERSKRPTRVPRRKSQMRNAVAP
jgi:hypothetical protein